MAVVRKDIVQIDFDINNKPLSKVQSEMDKIRSAITGVGKEDGIKKLSVQTTDLKDETDKAKKSSDKLKDSLDNVAKTDFSKLKNGLKAVGKAALVGLGAAASGVATVVGASTKAYAEFEQLEGGVKKLFGDSSAQTIFKDANDAYKTVGMSANKYMETATGFSASLITSLGGDTQKAADLTNVAMKDMADNANIFGTDLETVTNVYQGLAKEQYMLLDNLKLGYAGTKEGAEELVNKAATLDKSVKANDLSFSNLVKAIHAVQVEMNITGTTENEAAKTVTGSLNAMKSAWGNLMTAIGTGENLDQCMNNMLDSVEVFGDNIMPVIERSLSGIGTLVERVAPVIADKLPTLVDKLLPPLLQASASLFGGVIKALPGIIKVVIKELPDIAIQLGEAIGEVFGINVPEGVMKKIGGSLLGLLGIGFIFKKLGGISKIFGGITNLFGKNKKDTSIGKAVTGPFESLEKVKFTTILKGIAGLVLVIAALGALLWIATKVFKNGVNFTEMFQVIVLIGILGLVGTGLAKLSSYIGKIPVSTVAMGLANMAIILAGVGALLWIATKVFKNGVNFTEMFQVIVLIGVLGTVGSVLAIFAGIVGLIPIPIVLAGLANIALVIAGFAAILWALDELSKIPGFMDFIEGGGEVLCKLANILGEAVGSIIGGIGEGITNSLPKIGENLAAFGENIKPFFESMSGIDMKGVGIFVGALAGLLGIATGNSIVDGIKSLFGNDEGTLGQLGTQLSAFATNATVFLTSMKTYTEEDFNKISLLFNALGSIKALPGSGGFAQYLMGDPYVALKQLILLLPGLGMAVTLFFTTLGGITDFSAITNLFNALSSIKELPSAGGFAQYFMGDPYAGMKEMVLWLPSLGTSVASFFTALGDVTDFTAITNLFNALGSVKELPKAGGFAQYFAGDVYSGMKQLILWLPSLGTSVGEFFTNLGDISDFSTIPALFNALGSVKELPKAGGFAQFFTGDVYAGLKEMITWLPLLGTSTLSFFTSVANIDDFSKISKLFDALAGVSALPEDDGFWTNLGDAITGQETMSQMELMSKDLQGFAENTKDFFAIINNLNLNKLNGLWNSLKKPEAITTNLTTIIGDKIDELVEKIKTLPEKMGEGLKSTGTSLGDALVEIWKDAVKASTTPVNKVISGANWIMKEFGSDKRVSEWKPYAKGTNGHKGGNALVNDGRGAELIQMPNGRTFIPNDKNIFMPNAPKGMKVLSAEQTARLMGRKSPTFRYADGVGDIDIWSYLDNAGGLVKKITDNVSYNGMTSLATNISKGMVSTISGPMSAWVEKAFAETDNVKYVSSKGVTQWLSTVVRALKMEGQYSLLNVARTLFQMNTESGGNPNAINTWDSNAKAGIPSKGLMQVIDPTFKAYARKGFDKNIYDPLSNILASIRYAVSRYGSLGKAYQGHGYANGVGEISLPQETPENSAMFVANGQVQGGDNFNINFNITVSGSENDRDLARKIKQFVKEAMDDVFDTLSNKTPVRES